MDFPPILILGLIWLLIGLPLSRLNKAAKKQQAARSAGRTAPKAEEAPKQEPAGSAPAPEYVRPSVLQPSITLTENDDSVYQGSMNAFTGEGCDPCHDEQLEPLTLAETAAPAAEASEPGLRLSWTGNEIVRGFVMSQILDRK